MKKIEKVWSVLLSEYDFENFTDKKQLNFFVKEWLVEKETPKTITIIVKDNHNHVAERKHLKKEKLKYIIDSYNRDIVDVVSLHTYVICEEDIEKAKEKLLHFHKGKVKSLKEKLMLAENLLSEHAVHQKEVQC